MLDVRTAMVNIQNSMRGPNKVCVPRFYLHSKHLSRAAGCSLQEPPASERGNAQVALRNVYAWLIAQS